MKSASIALVSSYKHLGVTYSENPTWNAYIEMIVNIASRTLEYFRRHLYLAPHDVNLFAYKSFGRSIFEYARVIWSPQPKLYN